MGKEALSPKGLALVKAPFSPGIKSGNFIFTSGQIAFDPDTLKPASEDIEVQTRMVIESAEKILEAGGATLDDVVKVTLFITDFDEFGKVNKVYSEYFKENAPARSTVQVAKLGFGVRIELEAIAYKE